MTDYRTYLDRKGAPRGPWVVMPHEQAAAQVGRNPEGGDAVAAPSRSDTEVERAAFIDWAFTTLSKWLGCSVEELTDEARRAA